MEIYFCTVISGRRFDTLENKIEAMCEFVEDTIEPFGSSFSKDDLPVDPKKGMAIQKASVL